MRVTLTLTAAQVRALALICRRERISRTEAVRRAVSEYLSGRSGGPSEVAFGIWRGRDTEGLDYQRRARREW